MKNLFLLFLLLPWQLIAQQVTVSEPISIRNSLTYDLIGQMGEHFLYLRDDGGSFELEAFDNNMKVSWAKELELDQRRPQILHVLGHNDRFHVFYSHVQEGNTHLKVHSYDPGALLVDSVTIKDYGFTVGNIAPIDFLLSDDREVVSLLEMRGRNEFRLLSFRPNGLETIWERTVFIDGVSNTRDFIQAFNDNRGNVYLVFEEFTGFGGGSSSTVEIVRVGAGEDETGADLARYKVFLNEFSVYDVKFVYDNLNQRLVGAGLYSADNYARAEGSFFVSIDPDVIGFMPVYFSAFDDQFATSFMGKGEGKKNRGISDAGIQHLVLRRDGGLLVFGERVRVFERFGGGIPMPHERMGGRYTTDYFFDEMFVLSYHPTGDLHFRHLMYKKQFSQDDFGAYSSFYVMKSTANLRLIYNDEIKFENIVSEYVLEGNGALNRNSVLSTQNQKIRLRFQDAVQISANEIIVPSEHRHRLKLVRIRF